MYLSLTVTIYTALLAASIVFIVLLLLRSNRSTFFYAFIWYCLGMGFWLMFRLLEILAQSSGLKAFYIEAGLVTAGIMIPLIINLLYALIIRQSMPFILQMIGGAAALSLIMLIFPYAGEIGGMYQESQLSLLLLGYLWLPAWFVILSIPLASVAIGRSLISLSSLSFERVLANSPDYYMLIDRYGWLADHNGPAELFNSCKDRSDLLSVLESNQVNNPEAWKNLKKAILLPHEASSGEIELAISGSPKWYAWSFKPIIRRKGSLRGSVLLLSDRSHIRHYMTILNEQNENLVQLHAELADYEKLTDQYTEEATRQEIADYIDSSVRERMNQSFDQMMQLRRHDDDASSRLAIRHLLTECRRALTDVRALVKRLSE